MLSAFFQCTGSNGIQINWSYVLWISSLWHKQNWKKWMKCVFKKPISNAYSSFAAYFTACFIYHNAALNSILIRSYAISYCSLKKIHKQTKYKPVINLELCFKIQNKHNQIHNSSSRSTEFCLISTQTKSIKFMLISSILYQQLSVNCAPYRHEWML